MTASRILLSLLGGVIVLVTIALFAAHLRDRIYPKPKQDWRNGYWLWAGEPPAAGAFRPDILYVEAPGARWPKDLPDAGQYVAVRRLEPDANLTEEAAVRLAADYTAVSTDARPALVTGLQIDYDAPSGQLESYARFLGWVRRDLPAGSRLSITALLDWFRPGTALAHVLRPVDEFVPQFYDAGLRRESAGIAEPVDSSKWAPVFNRYRTPYRIGIATFGRISRRRADGPMAERVQFFRDASPLEFATRFEAHRTVRATPAGENIVHYKIVSLAPNPLSLRIGDAVEITFPTEASIRSAYLEARRFGGYAAGAIFFRWPTRSETVTFAPDDVERIVAGVPVNTDLKLDEREAHCLERRCADLYLDPGRTLHAEDRFVRIRVAGELELFQVGGQLGPVGGRGGDLVFHVPAYSGLGEIYLGRAISNGVVHFEVLQP